MEADCISIHLQKEIRQRLKINDLKHMRKGEGSEKKKSLLGGTFSLTNDEPGKNKIAGLPTILQSEVSHEIVPYYFVFIAHLTA